MLTKPTLEDLFGAVERDQDDQAILSGPATLQAGLMLAYYRKAGNQLTMDISTLDYTSPHFKETYARIQAELDIVGTFIRLLTTIKHLE